ncbi:MAG: HlyC/CorC family transporter [Lachnospiraceae bacterium]|nr:HlyC/CorC family transporter [Lachnospiraceae bacterium]
MSTIIWQLLLQAVLIGINAFFAGTEMALVSLNTTKLHRLEEDGDKHATKLLKLVEEPSAFLSTIQVGITLAGYLGSALAAENFSGYLMTWIYEDLKFTAISESVMSVIAIFVITLILAYFTLVFGELVPKRIAMQKSYEMAKFSYKIISGISFVMKPIIKFLSFSTNLVLKLMRLKTEAEEEEVTEEEIRMMVDISEETGNIDENEKEWIQNIFDFDDLNVRRVMTPRTDVVAISAEASNEDILQIIEESGRSRYPVYGEDLDDIVGILYARDFLLALGKEGDVKINDILRSAYFVPESIHADRLFTDMQKKKIHIAIIVDEYGAMEGLVTMEDLVEEIVGNIYDEFDPEEEPEIVKLEENLWKVTGNTAIETMAEELEIELDTENLDYDTVGGLIISLLQAIPEDGVTFDVEGLGLHIHVEDIVDRRIEKAYISKVKQEETEEE